MNISEQIINVVDDLCEKVGIVIDWTSDTVVPILQNLCSKFITFEIWTSVFWIIFWVFLAGISWVLCFPCAKKAKKYEFDPCYGWSWVGVAMIIVTIVSSIVAIIILPIQIYDIIEAITFPEKTIYDYISYQISLLN